MLKAPVAHDGYGRVVKRLLRWAVVLLVPPTLCVIGSLFLSREPGLEHRVARMDVEVIRSALEAYRVQHDEWPSESSWAERLVAAKLLERAPRDPWGHAYRFRRERVDAGVER